jgi:hypothetical protein
MTAPERSTDAPEAGNGRWGPEAGTDEGGQGGEFVDAPEETVTDAVSDEDSAARQKAYRDGPGASA